MLIFIPFKKLKSMSADSVKQSNAAAGGVSLQFETGHAVL
jgi:hypothetical protein